MICICIIIYIETYTHAYIYHVCIHTYICVHIKSQYAPEKSSILSGIRAMKAKDIRKCLHTLITITTIKKKMTKNVARTNFGTRNLTNWLLEN